MPLRQLPYALRQLPYTSQWKITWLVLILTQFTAIFINIIITIPFTSYNVFHVKVINSPGSNHKSDHIDIHIIMNPRTHEFVLLNIAHHIHFINPINVSAHGISYAVIMWTTISMYIPSFHINYVKCLVNLQVGKGDITNISNSILCPYMIYHYSPISLQSYIITAVYHYSLNK